MCFATIGELTGSIIWGVYRYRLHNLPLFVLAGARSRVPDGPRDRGLSSAARTGARRHRSGRGRDWGLLGLLVLPRRDVAGAVGVPLLLLFLWRSPKPRPLRERLPRRRLARALRNRDRHVAMAHTLPGLGIPDGNPPSGVASGYVWFDVMAMLVAPYLLMALAGSSPCQTRLAGQEARMPGLID